VSEKCLEALKVSIYAKSFINS